MATTEKLKFKLELYATMWNKPPIADITIDGKSYFKEEITSTNDKPAIIEFEQELELEKSHKLIITRSGKGKNETVVKDGKIVKDQLLHIKSIEIDDIDIEDLVWEAIYTPKNKPPQKRTTCLGINGTWCLTFKSPFYLWLLERKSW